MSDIFRFNFYSNLYIKNNFRKLHQVQWLHISTTNASFILNIISVFEFCLWFVKINFCRFGSLIVQISFVLVLIHVHKKITGLVFTSCHETKSIKALEHDCYSWQILLYVSVFEHWQQMCGSAIKPCWQTEMDATHARNCPFLRITSLDCNKL